MDPLSGQKPEIPTGLFGWLTTTVAGTFWVFKTFLTKSSADKTYVKKVEADGTRSYVHPQEWAEMKARMDKSIDQGEKWQMIAKDWMNRP